MIYFFYIMFHSGEATAFEIEFYISTSPWPSTLGFRFYVDHGKKLHPQIRTTCPCFLLIERQRFQAQFDAWPSSGFIHTSMTKILLGWTQMLSHWKICKLSTELKSENVNYPALSHLKIKAACVGRHLLPMESIWIMKNFIAYCTSLFSSLMSPWSFPSLLLCNSTLW